LRIIDFDYAHYIEGIYQRNYLSNQIVAHFSFDLCNKLKSLSEVVECKAIHDSRGIFKGIAIYITRVESSEMQRLQELLNPVIWGQ
jgi:hypothetical protein